MSLIVSLSSLSHFSKTPKVKFYPHRDMIKVEQGQEDVRLTQQDWYLFKEIHLRSDGEDELLITRKSWGTAQSRGVHLPLRGPGHCFQLPRFNF